MREKEDSVMTGDAHAESSSDFTERDTMHSAPLSLVVVANMEASPLATSDYANVMFLSKCPK